MNTTTAWVTPGSGVVDIFNPGGKSPVVLVCEHASKFIPEEYGDLGLSADALNSHIAWDPGAIGVARHMARLLDAPLVSQKVSRLIYDCNRPPESAEAMRDYSEAYDIPGNSGLSDAQRTHRINTVYLPFTQALSAFIADRNKSGPPPVIVTIHTFTKTYNAMPRSVEIGILHDTDADLADRLIAAASGASYDLQRNQPYGPKDGVTHTLVTQAQSQGFRNVMIEIRSDLVETPQAEQQIATWLVALLNKAEGI